MESNLKKQEALPMQRRIMKFIVKSVYEHFSIDPMDIPFKRRTIEYIIPKQISIYLIKNNAPLITNSEIAKVFAFENHASSIHAYKKINGYLPHDKALKTLVDSIQLEVVEYIKAQFNGTEALFIQNQFNEKIEYLRIALELNNITATYTDCCMIHELYKRMCEVRSEFSVSDIVKIKNRVLLKSINNIH